jgi:hypothetical protein
MQEIIAYYFRRSAKSHHNCNQAKSKPNNNLSRKERKNEEK